jgi:hypothetical protein
VRSRGCRRVCSRGLFALQIAEACLRCNLPAQALQYLEIWAAALSHRAAWPSAASAAAAAQCTHAAAAVAPDVLALRLQREEALLWASLQRLGEADAASGLATTSKVRMHACMHAPQVHGAAS